MAGTGGGKKQSFLKVWPIRFPEGLPTKGERKKQVQDFWPA